MLKFIRTYILVFALICIFGCADGRVVEVNDFKDSSKYGFTVLKTENSRICINSEIQIIRLERVKPKLDVEKIKLEIEKEQLVTIKGIGRNSRVSVSVENEDICRVEKVGFNRYSIRGLCDGKTVVEFVVNGDRFGVEVEVWHRCTFGEWCVIEDSTCVVEGTRERSCSVCGEIEEETIEKKAHRYRDCVCEDCYSTLYVNEEGREVILTESICESNGISMVGSVVVPEYVMYDGERYRVVGIGVGLFMGSSITSIELPDSIKYIGEFAFDGCEKLERCELKEGLGYIGKAAFQCCYKLEWLELPSTVWYIGNFAFNHNSSLGNRVIRLPDSLEHLGEDIHCPAHMFYDCGESDSFEAFSISVNNRFYKVVDGIVYTRDGRTLVSVPVGKKFKDGIFRIPEGVENLGELSFSRNRSVREIVIPDSLVVDSGISRIESRYYLNDGNELSVGCYGYSGVERYSCYPNSEKYQCVDGVLYSRDLSRIIAVPNQYSGDLVVPEGVKHWSREAIWSEVEYFSGMAMDGIKNITIPSSIESIDDGQVEVINELVEMYGVRVVSNSSKYVVSNGYLVCK